jgi:hypothetical protein
MSAQTPQTDAVFGPQDEQLDPNDEGASLCRTLEAERDHYKALCEELREALQAAIKHIPLDESYAARTALRAALKKAEKP